ncbi:MAG: hypothetical protein LBD14_01600 [Puniceicoccales bacterium]|jgi:hypothetical protein|nr:hypothetical protein [Puniceicoccales bacterium]
MRTAPTILATTFLLPLALILATATGCRDASQSATSSYVYRGPLARDRGAYVKEVYMHEPEGQKYTLIEAYMDTTGNGNADLLVKFTNGEISELCELSKLSIAAYWPIENSRRPNNSDAPAALVKLLDATHTPPKPQTLEEFHATPTAGTRAWQLATQLRNARDELAEKIIAAATTALTQGRNPAPNAHILAGYDAGILALGKILKDTDDPALAQITSHAIRTSPRSAAPAITELIAALEKNRPEAQSNIFQTLEYEAAQDPNKFSRTHLNRLDAIAKTCGEEFNNHVKRIWLIIVDKETAKIILTPNSSRVPIIPETTAPLPPPASPRTQQP